MKVNKDLIIAALLGANVYLITSYKRRAERLAKAEIEGYKAGVEARMDELFGIKHE